jgi:hypothetical protein
MTLDTQLHLQLLLTRAVDALLTCTMGTRLTLRETYFCLCHSALGPSRGE